MLIPMVITAIMKGKRPGTVYNFATPLSRAFFDIRTDSITTQAATIIIPMAVRILLLILVVLVVDIQLSYFIIPPVSGDIDDIF